MPKRLVIVFDNAPDPLAPWMKQVASAAKLRFIDNDAVMAELAKDPKVRDTLDPKPADYAKAFEGLAGSDARIALHSSNWLGYLSTVSGFVFDLGPSDNLKKNPPKDAPPEFKNLVNGVGVAIQMVRDQAQKALPKERILELAPGTADSKKAELVQQFLSRLPG